MSTFLDAAIACHRRGDFTAARKAAHDGLAELPRHVALLHFLGMLEMRQGNLARARSCLEQAVAVEPLGPPLISLARLFARTAQWTALVALGPDLPPGPMADEYLQLRAQALAEIGDLVAVADALAVLADRQPGSPEVRVAAARALAQAGLLDRAEAAYRQVLVIWPSDEEALLGITGLMETLGRSRDLQPLFTAARRAGAGDAILCLGDAIARREHGDFAAALTAIDRAPGLLPAGTWHQMRGELADRAGDADTAFDAFAQMNAADAASQPEAQEGVRRFLASVDVSLAEIHKPVRVLPPGERPPPLFLLGFPRSGTTLLDTFLMGHPAVRVHEERPFLDQAATLAPDPGFAPGADDIERMRKAYWQALDAETDLRAALQIDKFPLATARALLIHRLFPDARFIFAMRHPCDVVLSCFMTRFRLNWGVASFLSLEDAANLYSRIMSLWIPARELLDLTVLEVRYEALVADPADVIGGVVSFCGLEEHSPMLDHASTARRRGLITTPSFAQVLEPVTQRAIGRWTRYRTQLAPVLPVLAPWCEQFGYSIDD